MPVSEKIRRSIYRRVQLDLEPSALVVHGKIGGSAAVGGFLSLLFCGQFGVALTPFAGAMQGQLMDLMGFIGCTMTCGLIFSILPVFLLKLMCSPMQFFILTHKRWQTVSGWLIGCGIAFILIRGGGELVDIGLWTIAATATYFLLARLVGWLMDGTIHNGLEGT